MRHPELTISFIGVRGTAVAIARLDRDQEHNFQPSLKIDNISAMNNFEFSEDGHVTVHRQYQIGPGKVCISFSLQVQSLNVYYTEIQDGDNPKCFNMHED